MGARSRCWSRWSAVAAGSAWWVACAGGAAPAPEPAELRQFVLNGYVDQETSGVLGMSRFVEDHFFVGHCSGALIAPNLVLTAAHCLLNTQNPLDSSVICGQNDELFGAPASQLLASAALNRPTRADHPSYHRGLLLRSVPESASGSVAGVVCGSDLALLILEDNLPTAEARLLVPRVDQRATAGEHFSAVGFGLSDLQSAASAGTRMRADDYSVVCAGEGCASIDGDVFASEWLSDDARVCAGDSGGPALDELGRVMGVASRGFGTCESIIYGDVGRWGDFVRDVALEAADRGGYEAAAWVRGASSEQAVAELREEERRSLQLPDEGCALVPLPGSRSPGTGVLVALGCWLALGLRRLSGGSRAAPLKPARTARGSAARPG